MAEKITVSKIISDLHISRARLYQIISRLDESDKPHKDSSDHYVFTEKTYQAIKSYHDQTKTQPKHSENTKTMMATIDLLKHQLDAKDRQIEKLTTLVDQAQQLQLISSKKIEKLENTPKQDDSKENAPSGMITPKDGKNGSERKWWRHFF